VGTEIRGEAEVLELGGADAGLVPEIFRINPKRIVSWRLEEQISFRRADRSPDTAWTSTQRMT
jgi:hypothetical protein